ncbi:type II secretion system protein G [Limihaloglobus sulfuriphilus]|uniref:Type II secretion system protein G n=1 Tax=Limihaloglobus sulfuriphilus TaxID=1851148 RepID=A0A1Q2MBY4_9BACT|nr:type II secretion system protein [Limihaloglobus sulfuriphilus]AQQ70048.1 type II secretion system protein G [Limihaloglobus sulfuriphilus]
MKRKAFTLIELLVVISIIALLMAILMPSLTKAREAAKTVVCGSNMRQWALIFAMYTNDNDGMYHYGWISAQDGSALWPAAMRPYYDSPEIRTCPKASNPQKTGAPFGVWGPFKQQKNFWTDALEGDYGSYGVNWYICSRETGLHGAEGVGNENFWRKTGHKNADNIPILADSWWYCGLPNDDDPPPSFNGEVVSDNNKSMNRFCVDRHNGYVQVSFMDGSGRKVGLKELWTLKWHKSFDTEGMFTIKGNGGNPSNAARLWNAMAPWMSKYKEY